MAGSHMSFIFSKEPFRGHVRVRVKVRVSVRVRVRLQFKPCLFQGIALRVRQG